MQLPWQAEHKRWVTGAAAAGALLMMSVPSPVGAQDVPAPLVSDHLFESATVTSLGLVLWAAATWLRRQHPAEPAMPPASSAPERAGRTGADASSVGDRTSKAA